MGRATAYTLVHNLVSLYISDITYEESYDKQFIFFLTTVPNYIEGMDVEIYIEELYNSIPDDLKENEKKKQFKQEIKKLFTYSSKKPLLWVQEPEWFIMDKTL